MKPVLKVAVFSMHTCPLAVMGGKKTGGMNIYVRELAKAFTNFDVHVDIFTRLQNKCQPQISNALGEGIRVIHIPAGPQVPLTTMQVAQYVKDFAQGVKNFVEQDIDSASNNICYDLIHSHYWLSGLAAEQFNKHRFKKIPVVQMFHTLGHLKGKISAEIREEIDPQRIKSETHIIQKVADHVVAATESEKSQLITLYEAEEEKISVIPPGVDLSIFKPQDQSLAKSKIDIDCAHKLILFAGRIEPLKGIDTLLQAVRILDSWSPATVADKCLVIIGGDPWEEDPESEMYRLQRISEDLGIKRQVAFVGAKDQRILPDYYAAADVVVMPSHYESFGMVALEAMAVGRPVIASEVGGLADLVNHAHNGLHVNSRDPEALAKALHALLSDDEYHKKIAKQASKDALEYGWDRIAQSVFLLYQKLVNKKSICKAR